jgi:hypothetical protein
MNKLGYIALFTCFLAQSCKEDIGNTSWDVDLLAPVITTSLNLGDLLNDTILTSDSDGKLRLFLERDLLALSFDSILKIPDTTIAQTLSLPFALNNLPAGSTIPPVEEITNYELGDKSIKTAKIREGKLTVKFTNLLETKVRFDYTVESATINGSTLDVSEWVEVGGASTTTEVEVDLAGYTFDLSGPTGASANQLVSNYSVTTDPDGATITVSANSQIFDLEYTFSEITLDYGLGYFGQESVTTENDTTTLQGMQNIVEGSLFLDSATVGLTVVNGVGMDGIFQLNELNGINTRTGNNVVLSHAIIGDAIMMARAQDLDGTPEGISAVTLDYQLNNDNSNVKAFIENLPDQLDFSFDMSLNPLGNVSAGNDFFYFDSPFKAKIKVDIPMRVRADNVVLQDTLAWDLGQGSTVESINYGTLTMIVNNGFPLIGEPQLIMLDSNFALLDTLLFPAQILAPELTSEGKVEEAVESRITIDLPESKMELMPETRHVIIRMGFSTVSQPDLIGFYEDYSLDIKLVGNFNFTFKP